MCHSNHILENQSTFECFYLSTYQPTYLSIYLSTELFIGLPIYLPTYLSIYLSTDVTPNLKRKEIHEGIEPMINFTKYASPKCALAATSNRVASAPELKSS